jgi:hypothetical protein
LCPAEAAIGLAAVFTDSKGLRKPSEEWDSRALLSPRRVSLRCDAAIGAAATLMRQGCRGDVRSFDEITFFFSLAYGFAFGRIKQPKFQFLFLERLQFQFLAEKIETPEYSLYPALAWQLSFRSEATNGIPS